MTSLVVISFAREDEAIGASNKLKELESSGTITVYERVMARKAPDGKVTILESDTSEGLRTISGMALGTMAGAFMGPVGLVIGLFTGTAIGAATEGDYFDFAEDFATKTIDHLQPGIVVIVAEIYEEGPASLDLGMEPFGATLSRSNIDYIHDDYVDGKIKGIEQEIAAERDKIKSAVEADKARIRQRIEHLKEKRKQRIAELKQKQNSVIGKIRTLANDGKRARLVKSIAVQEKKLDDLESRLKKIQ